MNFKNRMLGTFSRMNRSRSSRRLSDFAPAGRTVALAFRKIWPDAGEQGIQHLRGLVNDRQTGQRAHPAEAGDDPPQSAKGVDADEHLAAPTRVEMTLDAGPVEAEGGRVEAGRSNIHEGHGFGRNPPAVMGDFAGAERTEAVVINGKRGSHR